MTKAYEKATSHKLNSQNTVEYDISIGVIPQVESMFKEVRKYHKDRLLDIILVFEHNEINLFLYCKGLKSCLVKIPYSDIKHYYYKIDQDYKGISFNDENEYDAVNVYIALKQGSIVIADKDAILDIPHILHVLKDKTTSEQQVKPTCSREVFGELSSTDLVINVQELIQKLSDKQQRNKIHHKVVQDVKGTTKRTHYMQDVY